VPHLQRVLCTDLLSNYEEPGKHSSVFSTLVRQRRIRNGEGLLEPELLLPLIECAIQYSQGTPNSHSSGPQLGQITRAPEYCRCWKLATAQFKSVFIESEFGHKCDVCDRL
jgi:hypothetical protein